MSDYIAIADVGETLIELLRYNMQDLVPADSISLVSPGEIEGKDSIRLSLFLFQISENIYLKNLEMEAMGSSRLKAPPLVVDLYYMLTSYSPSGIQDRTERTIEEHRILGRAMQILHDNAVLTGSVLKGSLAANSYKLHMTLAPLSLDDMTKMWTTFQGKPFRSSICYLVTPVMIDTKREITVQRVVSKEAGYNRTVPE